MLKSCNICGKLHKHGEPCPYKKSNRKNSRREDEFRATSLWKNKRSEIKRRDGYCCAYCKYINVDINRDKYNFKDLSVHHIVPLSEDFDRRLDNDNLITLCRVHHEEAERGIIQKMSLFNAVLQVPPGG